MLELLDQAIKTELVENAGEWCERIGFHQSNLRFIRNGERSFTIDQIIAACQLAEVSLDWVVGISTDRKRVKSVSPIQQLKEAVIAVESAFGKEKGMLPKKLPNVTKKKAKAK